MALPIASPGAGDVPRSHRDRLSRLERRIKPNSARKPVKFRRSIDFGVAGPVVVGATPDWPCPDNLLTVEVHARLRTASSSGSVTGLLKKNSTTVLTVTFTSGTSGSLFYPLTVRGTKDTDVFWLDVTGAGTGAAYLNVQLRYR